MKNLKAKIYPLLLAQLVTLFSFGGSNTYRYKRELKGDSAGWRKLTLPDEVLGKVNHDLSDIRIFGVTEKGDTVEVPYVAQIAEETIIKADIAFKLINQTHNAKGYYFTFDLASEQTINQIHLSFTEHNFDWKVSLNGSQDLKNWSPVIENYRILSIKNELTDYSFTAVNFPDAKYRYYQVEVQSALAPHLVTAQISEQVLTPGLYKQYTLKAIKLHTDQQLKQTIAELELPLVVPVSSLRFSLNDKIDFYRPVTIQYLSDSTKTVNGWTYNYTDITSGVLSSLEKHEFKFNNTFCSRIKITISNGDNPPLQPDSFMVSGNIYTLYARFTQSAKYYLYYGNTNGYRPDYDISRFKNNIPADVNELTLSNEEVIPEASTPAIHPLIENKKWLWVIMAIIILLLGWFTLKMMKDGPSK